MMPLNRERPARGSVNAAPGRRLLAALPSLLLLADALLVAAWIAPHGARALLMIVGLPAAAAGALGWRAALRARHLARVLFPVALALAACLAVLTAVADLAGAPPLAGSRLDNPRLAGSRLDNPRLAGSRLDDAPLAGSRLDDAPLAGSRLDDPPLAGNRLDDPRLAGAALSLLLLRLILCLACRRAERRSTWACERVAILGTGPDSVLLHRTLVQRRIRGITLAARFDPTSDGIAALLRHARTAPLDRVLLAVPAPTDPRHVQSMLRQLKTLDVRIDRCAAELLVPGAAPPDRLPLIELAPRPISSRGLACKAAADKLLSLVLIAAIVPVLVAVVVAIRLDSPGPILFRQQREGRNGADFQILKFRTMRWRAPGGSGRVVQTARNDSRVTRVGRILRATSLDELPQLLNVLRGDMSLVGPRPHPQAMTTEDRLSVDIAADYPHRHRVKPGMTGWAQINGSRGGLRSSEELCQRLRYDLDYIENWSLWLDLKIALLTPLKMIFHDGAAF